MPVNLKKQGNRVLAKTNVAFIGLGVMGAPMAGHLCHAGFNVQVYNRTAQKAQTWQNHHNGQAHISIESAVLDAQYAILCVSKDEDVLAVITAICKTMPAGGVVIDHSTVSAQCAHTALELCQKASLDFIDAPVSGGEIGAQTGQLTIMCGGTQSDVNSAHFVMDSYAKAIQHMGVTGSGQLAKMVNQICIAGLIQALAEGVEFAKRAGLDMDKLITAISQGAAGSWQMQNRAQTMAKDEFDFGFAVDHMRKDLAIALQEARTKGLELPVTNLVDSYYKDLQEQGHGRMDTSSLIKRLVK